MATFIKISQGSVTTNGRNIEMTWAVVNTTLADEQRLMKEMFLPLLYEEEDMAPGFHKKFQATWSRFFHKGMFLFEHQYIEMNDLLNILDYPRVILENDGRYYQPTLPGKFKPCAKSWKFNGQSRSKEMQKIIDEVKATGFDISTMKNQMTCLESMFE